MLEAPFGVILVTYTIQVSEAERSLLEKDKVVVPMRLPQDVNYKLEYATPANFNVVGSYPLKTRAKTGDDLVLDLMVMMPPVSLSSHTLVPRKAYNENRNCLNERTISIIDTSTNAPTI